MASSLISLSQSVAAAAQRGKNSFLIPRTECCKAHVHLPVVQLSLNQIGIINFKDCWNPFFDFQYLIVSVWTAFSVRGRSVLSAVGSSEYPLKSQLCWWYYLPHYHIPHPWDAYMESKFLAGRESDFFFFSGLSLCFSDDNNLWKIQACCLKSATHERVFALQ